MSDPEAYIENRDGEMVLVDPSAKGMIAAVEVLNRKVRRENCLAFLKQNEERMLYFARRIRERGLVPQEWVMVCLLVDDPFGGPLAEKLMPGHDWQAIRDKGEVPVARGFAQRPSFQRLLDRFFPEAAETLKAGPEYVVVVAAFGEVIAVPQQAPAPDTVWERLQYDDPNP